MAGVIIALPGFRKLYVEVDDTSGEFIGLYDKTQITADIQAIRTTLEQYPSPSQEASDMANLLTVIGSAGWNNTKTTRITNLVNTMYQFYGGEQVHVEQAQLQAKLDSLIALRERLV